jgi:hypothetical protein
VRRFALGIEVPACAARPRRQLLAALVVSAAPFVTGIVHNRLIIRNRIGAFAALFGLIRRRQCHNLAVWPASYERLQWQAGI